MRSYILNIAGFRIKTEQAAEAPVPVTPARFINSLVERDDYDLKLRVHRGPFLLPTGAEMVFHAPVADDKETGQRITDTEFWDVYSFEERYFIKAVFPGNEKQMAATMEFSPESCEWDIWIDGDCETADPMAYPMDGLILYYLAVTRGGIMIHASGINYAGKGYIFSGVSGRGKTTMAGLWKKAGAEVIHDDRLIIRKLNGGYFFFNTPVYDNEKPLMSPLHAVYLIEHGSVNSAEPVTGATASGLVLANCIQHNWNREMISGLLDAVTDMCEKIPVMKLSFRPDNNVIDFILNNG